MTETLTNSLTNPPTTELIGRIVALREAARAFDSPASGPRGEQGPSLQYPLLSSLDRIEEAARLAVSEHAGMADELIGLYEQLGAVFDITRRLPHLRDEQQVAVMFKDTIAATFNRHEVAVAYPSEGTEPRPSGSVDSSEVSSTFNLQPSTLKPLISQPWMSSLFEQAVALKRTQVVASPVAECHGQLVCPRQTLVGKPPVAPTRPSASAGGEATAVPSSPTGSGTTQSCCPTQGSDASHPTRGSDATATIVEVLAAPVFCAEELVFVIVVGRGPGSEEFQARDMNLADVLTAYCGDLIGNFRLHHQLRQISVNLVRSLVSTVDQKDPYTSGHSIRVGYYATLLGCAVGLDAEALQMLEWSALLHDVGKIGIRDDVLKKPGKLTAEEFEHIKEHPVRSFEVVRRVPQLESALDGIRHHHEHFDGSGYPDGLTGEEIPFQARIVQVADVFDALTSCRSYRKSFHWEKALHILAGESGTTVDRALTKLFCELIRQRCEGNPQAWEALTREAELTLSGEASWQRLSEAVTSPLPHDQGSVTTLAGGADVSCPLPTRGNATQEGKHES